MQMLLQILDSFKRVLPLLVLSGRMAGPLQSICFIAKNLLDA